MAMAWPAPTVSCPRSCNSAFSGTMKKPPHAPTRLNTTMATGRCVVTASRQMHTPINTTADFAAALEDFIRDATVTYRHQTCTARMGRDAMAVVDSNLAAYGIEGLRIADGSIMPRVPTGNTMAPCVIVGERCGEILQNKYGL